MKLNSCLLATTIFLFLSSSVAADTIVFNTERRLTGKVIPPLEDDETVTVILTPDKEDPTQSGSIVLSMDTIDHIDYDYDSLNNSLEDDDYSGHYKLGVWCIDRQIYDKAIDQLMYVNGMPGIPVEANYYLGLANEKMSSPKLLEAREYYLDYLEKAKEGEFFKEADEAIEVLTKRIEKLGLERVEAEPVISNEGYEVDNWRGPGWGNKAVLTTPELKGGTENLLLRVQYSGTNSRGKRIKNIDDAKAPIQLAVNMDVSDTPIITFMVYNPEDTKMDISVAVTTGDDYEWFECDKISIPPKMWKSVRLDFTFATWRSNKTGFAEKTSVQNLENVRNLVIVVRNRYREGKIYFDNIEFKKE